MRILKIFSATKKLAEIKCKMQELEKQKNELEIELNRVNQQNNELNKILREHDEKSFLKNITLVEVIELVKLSVMVDKDTAAKNMLRDTINLNDMIKIISKKFKKQFDD